MRSRNVLNTSLPESPTARAAGAGCAVQIVVAVGDLRVSGAIESTLATYALGSCVGVVAYDPVARVGGLLHCQLPASSSDPGRAEGRPALFADTGMAALLREVLALGGQKHRLQVKLAGGAQMLGDDTLFNIGRRNYAAVRKALWQEGLLVDGEDIGGTAARTVFLQIADGAVLIKSGGLTSHL